MPKLKTNRAAAKRFRKTANGFKRYSSDRRHNLGHKDSQAQAPRCARAAAASSTRATSVASSSCCRTTSNAHSEESEHGTSQTWRDGRAPSQEGPRQGEGLLQRPAQGLSRRQAGGHQGRPVRLSRPAREEARVPRAVDHAHQCRGARARPVLQPPDRRPEQGGRRDRPQGAGGSRGPRCRTPLARSRSRPRASLGAA